MQRPFLPGHGLRIAVVTLVSLVVAPTAGAEDGVPIAADPLAMTSAIVDASLAALPAAPVVVTLSSVPPLPTAPEAVAAAAEPIPAQEPQPTPPPPQPQAPDPQPAPEEVAPPPDPVPAPAPAPAAPVEQPQYQPEPPQYQAPEPPPEPDPAFTTAPATAEPPATGWSWDWNWSCDDAGAPAQMPAVTGDQLPDTWNWNWDWNCGGSEPGTANSDPESGEQYQPVITQYHPVNVNVSIRIASPGDNGPVTQSNIVVVVEAPQVVATAQVPLIAPPAPPEPGSEPGSAAAPTPNPPAAAAEPPDEPKTAPGDTSGPPTMLASADQKVSPAEASSWNARPIPPRRLQPSKMEAHRHHPTHRRLTRRPMPPKRAPMIPVSSAGAAPLGGSDGGGFQLALLLVPFALALVDSARRLVRDTAPPVGRGHKKRQKRPG